MSEYERTRNITMKHQAPIAEVIESIEIDGNVRTVLRLDKVPSSPIAPAYIQSQTEPHELMFQLHLLFKREDNLLEFITYKVENNPLVVGGKYEFVCMWGPDQLEIAQSAAEKWRKKIFVPEDMISFNLGDGTKIGRKLENHDDIEIASVSENGWDHEHCRLCWRTISTYEDHQHEGYTDGKEWVCQDCYDRYILSGLGKKLGEAG